MVLKALFPEFHNKHKELMQMGSFLSPESTCMQPSYGSIQQFRPLSLAWNKWRQIRFPCVQGSSVLNGVKINTSQILLFLLFQDSPKMAQKWIWSVFHGWIQRCLPWLTAERLSCLYMHGFWFSALRKLRRLLKCVILHQAWLAFCDKMHRGCLPEGIKLLGLDKMQKYLQSVHVNGKTAAQSAHTEK